MHRFNRHALVSQSVTLMYPKLFLPVNLIICVVRLLFVHQQTVICISHYFPMDQLIYQLPVATVCPLLETSPGGLTWASECAGQSGVQRNMTGECLVRYTVTTSGT